MTFTETVQERGNNGDHRYVVTEVDITSLDSAGTEPYDAESRHNFNEVHGAEVLDQEDYTHYIHYNADASTPAIVAKDVADGTDLADNTDVGTVTLKFEGDWSA